MIELNITPIGRTRIRVSLEYSGEGSIEVYTSALPWSNFDSIILVAVEANAIGAPLPHELVIDDPAPSTVVIEPGERLHGDIDLASRFATLDKELTLHDIILFWSYEMRTVDNSVLPRVGGWIQLPRSHR